MAGAAAFAHHGVMTTPDDSTATQRPPGPPPPPPPPRWQHEARRLRRSTTDRYLGGVAGGIAQTYGIDPIIVRVGFVIASAFGGAGVLAYLALWVLVPPDDGTLPVLRAHHHDRGWIIGLVLLSIGVIAVTDRAGFGHAPFLFGFFWPLALIGGGIAILVVRANGAPAGEFANEPGAPVPPSPTTTATGPVGDTVTPFAATGTMTNLGPDDDPSAPPASPTAPTPTTQTAWSSPRRWPQPPPMPPLPPRPRRPRHPHVLGPLTLTRCCCSSAARHCSTSPA